MILPVIKYGDIIYGGAKGKPVRSLQTVQNRILRMCIYTNKYIATKQLYVIGKTSKLNIRCEGHLNLFMFKQQ